MKKAASFFILMIVMLGTVSSTLTGEIEDFEDDTVGAAPSGSFYTWVGSGSVTASGYAGNGVSFTGNTWSNRGVFQFSSFDWCEPGASISFDVLAKATSADSVRSVIGGARVNTIVNQDFASDGHMGLESWMGDADPNLIIGNGGGSTRVPVPMTPGNWHRVIFKDISCTSPSSITANVTDLDTGIKNEYTASRSITLGTFDEFFSGVSGFQTGFSGRTVDNLVLNPSIALAIEAPTGLSGVVSKTGSVSTSGRVDFTWTLSPDDDGEVGGFFYHVYEDGVKIATDSIDANDGGGVRSYSHYFTGSASFGSHNYTVRAESAVESPDSCSITLDLDTAGSASDCGVTPVVSGSPAEFDTGLVAAVESFGFQTAESKMLFTLILVGAVQATATIGSKFIASGRFKNYLILGAGAIVAVFAIFIDFLDLWEWIVAFMLGVFAVRGAGAARNTYFEIRDAIQDRRRFGDVGDVELKADVSDLGMGAGTTETGRGGRSGLGGDLDAMEADDGRETGPEGSQEDES